MRWAIKLFSSLTANEFPDFQLSPFANSGRCRSAFRADADHSFQADPNQLITIAGTVIAIARNVSSRRRLKQVDFRFEDHEIRGFEQNPDTKSRWAKMAREGKKVMQSLENGRYVAVVRGFKVHLYKLGFGL